MTKKVSEKMMTKILVRKEVTNRRGVVPQILQIWGTRTRSRDNRNFDSVLKETQRHHVTPKLKLRITLSFGLRWSKVGWRETSSH